MSRGAKGRRALQVKVVCPGCYETNLFVQELWKKKGEEKCGKCGRFIVYVNANEDTK